MFYAGIDWSDSHHDILVIDDAGRQGNASLRVSHTPNGLEKLHLFLETITGLDAKEEMAWFDSTVVLFQTMIEGCICPMGHLISSGFADGTGIRAMSVCRTLLWSMANHGNRLRKKLLSCFPLPFLTRAWNPPDGRLGRELDTRNTTFHER